MNKTSSPYLYIDFNTNMQINISHAIIIKQKKIYKTQFMLTTRKITNLTLTYLVKGSRTKEMKQATWIKYLKIVLPILFIGYLACIISFTHVHIVNGVTIVHSHPYNKQTNPPSDHQHTGQQLQLYQQFSSIHPGWRRYLLFYSAYTYLCKWNYTIVSFRKQYVYSFSYGCI